MKVGDIVYKYLTFNGFAEYIVTAEIIRETAKLYEVECQACQHGEKCRLLISSNKEKGEFHFVSMVNLDEEQERKQESWHYDNNFFYSDLIEAKKSKYWEVIKMKKNDISKHQEIFERLKTELSDLEQHYSNIK